MSSVRYTGNIQSSSHVVCINFAEYVLNFFVFSALQTSLSQKIKGKSPTKQLTGAREAQSFYSSASARPVIASAMRNKSVVVVIDVSSFIVTFFIAHRYFVNSVFDRT